MFKTDLIKRFIIFQTLVCWSVHYSFCTGRQIMDIFRMCTNLFDQCQWRRKSADVTNAFCHTYFTYNSRYRYTNILVNYPWICHRVEMTQQKRWYKWIFDDKMAKSREDLVKTEKIASKARIQSYLLKFIPTEESMCFVATMTESISVHVMYLLSNYFRKLVQIKALNILCLEQKHACCAVWHDHAFPMFIRVNQFLSLFTKFSN